MLRILNSLPLLYALMLWPGRFAIWDLYDGGWYYPQLMYDTGIWSIRLLILTVAVTPLLLLISRLGRGKAVGRWLLQRRRHFGLGSFIYATLHLIHYLIETASLSFVLTQSVWLEFAAGWVGFILFAALALTSNNWSVRRLGRKWKSLHNLLYPAAALTFLHWYLFDFFTERVMFWLALFVGLKLIHVAVRWVPRGGLSRKN